MWLPWTPVREILLVVEFILNRGKIRADSVHLFQPTRAFNTQTQLASRSQDEHIWAYYTDSNTAADPSILSRITFSSIHTSSPLHVVNQHASAAVMATSNASWRPLLVVVGRGKHVSAARARELSLMLAKQNQAPTVAAEIRKTVGDVATAMITSRMQAAAASFLVVQATQIGSKDAE
jgi:hypothetical protein